MRGIIRHAGRLLLVTDGNGYWYAPGGRLEPGESLPGCLVREVHEETGLRIQVQDLSVVSEFRDGTGEHKIECFFDASLIEVPGVLPPWKDTGGPVTRFGLFTPEELSELDVRPAFLASTPAEPARRREPVYVPASP